MSKIRIVNWLLTRRCNLKCDYCAIVKNYSNKPDEYPDMKHYIENEMTTDEVINGLRLLKLHNPDCFHILYGGEPLLRKDLADIINYCNDESIHYTIISNNTKEIQPMIEKLVKDVKGTIKGFTASIDPVFQQNHSVGRYRDKSLPKFDHSVLKSIVGLKSLKRLKGIIPDLVAEVTVMRHNQQHLYELVDMLTKAGINSDVTFIDIAKNPYYDFANVSDPELLIGQSPELAKQFQLISDNKVDVHMKEILIPEIWGILPSNMDCEIDKNLHNISVDADGSVRLCLRIRGTLTPGLVTLHNLFNETNDIHPLAHSIIKTDKIKHCKLCNHTCHLMSKFIDEHNLGPDDLVHLDRRK